MAAPEHSCFRLRKTYSISISRGAEADRVAVRVQRGRTRNAAAERIAQNEIERVQARQFVTHDIALNDIGEMRFYALRRSCQTLGNS